MNQSCSFINNKSNQCKFKSTNQYNNKDYCTRHYNEILLEFNNNHSKNQYIKQKSIEVCPYCKASQLISC